MNATINLHAYASLAQSDDGKIHFHAGDLGESLEFSLTPEITANAALPLPLHRAVYNRIVRDFNGGEPLPIRLSTYCDAPVGSGLGSSSTMTVALLKAFDGVLSLGLDQYALAGLAYDIERNDLALLGGYQDQYAASFGGINFIEFNRDHSVLVNSLRVNSDMLAELEASLLLYYTGVSRSSAAIIAGQRRQLELDDENVVARVHAIKEYAVAMKQALLVGDLRTLAETLHLSWMAKKGMTDLVSDERIDTIYDHVRSLGVLGGRISGAGGGGFMMFICDPQHLGVIYRTLEEYGGRVSRFHFSKCGAQSWNARL